MARATRLSHEEQIARFGMTVAEACEVRNRAERVVVDLTAARRAWQELAYELQGGKGQPFQCPAHPEAVRFKMLAALAEGGSIPAAVAAARAFAFAEAQ